MDRGPSGTYRSHWYRGGRCFGGLTIMGGAKARVAGWLLLAMMLAPFGFLVWAAYSWSTEFLPARRFDAVTSFCDPGLGSCGPDDALWLNATVLQTGSDRNGKHMTYWIDVTGLGTGTQITAPGVEPFEVQRLSMESNDGVWPLVGNNDQVIVTEWHGRYTDVSIGRVSSRTTDNPDVAVYRGLVTLTAALFASAASAWFMLAIWGRRRPRAAFLTAWTGLASLGYFVVVLVAKKAVYGPALFSAAAAAVVLFAAGLVLRRVRLSRTAATAPRPRPLDARPPDLEPRASASLAATSLSRRSGRRRPSAR